MKHTEDTSPCCWWWLASIFMCTVLVAILAACTAEELSVTSQEPDLPATISLDIRIDRPKHTHTRAVDENTIADLHVLIYNSQGELIGQKYEKYENNNTNKLTVNARSAKQCTIYAIANTGSEVLFKGREAATEEGLRGIITAQLAVWNGLNKTPYLLMAGSKEKVDILPGSNTLAEQNLMISSVVAKVKLNIKVAENSGITITDYRIYGLPRQGFYISDPTLDADTGIGTDGVTTTDESLWCNSEKIEVNSTTATQEFYMYENRRGINKDIEKAKDKCLENAPDSATYIIINGKTGYYNSTWRVYLGKNDTSNFNIERNVNYNFTITLSRNAADLRVDIDDIYPSTDEAQTSNCYILSPGHALTIPVLRANESPIQIGTLPMVNGKCIQLQEDTPWTAEVVWQSSPELVGVSNAIGKGPAGRFKVTTTDKTMQGNAVVAIRSGDNILWSWHIWVTTYDGSTTFTNNNGKRDWVFMDRALGATSITPGELSTCGLCYQWGRKDPFPGIGQAGGRWDITNEEADPIVVYNAADKPCHIELIQQQASLITSIQNPVTYYYVGNTGRDWLFPSNNDLWGGGNVASIVVEPKTAFDPCPTGWRVPPMIDNTHPFAGMANGGIANSELFGHFWGNNYWPFSGFRYNLNSATVELIIFINT